MKRLNLTFGRRLLFFPQQLWGKKKPGFEKAVKLTVSMRLSSSTIILIVLITSLFLAGCIEERPTTEEPKTEKPVDISKEGELEEPEEKEEELEEEPEPEKYDSPKEVTIEYIPIEADYLDRQVLYKFVIEDNNVICYVHGGMPNDIACVKR